ncbi:cofilin, partial [Ceratobasidium sp. 423]
DAKPFAQHASRRAQISGIPVNSQCPEKYQKLLKKDNKGIKYKYIIFKISDGPKEIVVEKVFDHPSSGSIGSKDSSDSSYNEFLGDLCKNEPRWGVYDFEYRIEGEGYRSKIVFFGWCPDDILTTPDAKPIQGSIAKVTHSASQRALRAALSGNITDIQGTDKDEVEWKTVYAKVEPHSN